MVESLATIKKLFKFCRQLSLRAQGGLRTLLFGSLQRGRGNPINCGGIYWAAIVLLGIIFSLYVVGDYATTVFMISASSAGIKSELNPLGVMIYNVMGSTGLLLSKLAAFAAIALLALRTMRQRERRKIVRNALGAFAIYSSVILGINLYTLSSILFL